MTVQELLKPRFRVIANYPESSYTVGEIITHETDGEYPLSAERFIKLFSPYPHLFKKLEWYEERDWSVLEDVKYVKTLAGNSVRTVKEFQTRLGKIVLDEGKVKSIKHWIPATQEEYEAFINQPA